MKCLHPGEAFPAISGLSVGGGTVNLPADIPSPDAIVLTCRAHW